MNDSLKFHPSKVIASTHRSNWYQQFPPSCDTLACFSAASCHLYPHLHHYFLCISHSSHHIFLLTFPCLSLNPLVSHTLQNNTNVPALLSIFSLKQELQTPSINTLPILYKNQFSIFHKINSIQIKNREHGREDFRRWLVPWFNSIYLFSNFILTTAIYSMHYVYQFGNLFR